uniref:Uncharacterized protein n=1 Tax=Cacopsylla melanoneura TaxID=428564 RepID=A0A8D9EST3_9HEMI
MAQVILMIQNVFKRANQFPLRTVLMSNQNARTILNMLIAIPLLGTRLMADALQDIRLQAEAVGLMDNFLGLINYIDRQWLYVVGPDILSVDGLENIFLFSRRPSENGEC